MGTISAAFDSDTDLTLVKATGQMTAADFHNYMVLYYAGKITPLILWDLTKADLSGLTTDEIRKIAQSTREISDIRKGGKTALVFDKTLEYGMGRMFEAYSDIADMPFEFRAFRNIDRAKKWLGV